MALQQVRTWLIADSDIRRLVKDRVFYLAIPEGIALPAITLQRLSTTPVNSLNGYLGLDGNVVTLDAWCLTYAQSLLVRDAARKCLQTNGIVMQSESEDYDSITRTFRISQQWQIWL